MRGKNSGKTTVEEIARLVGNHEFSIYKDGNLIITGYGEAVEKYKACEVVRIWGDSFGVSVEIA